MNKRDLKVFLERLDMHPSRKLGQNFLVDANLSSSLVRLAGVQPGERVLEVGPGAGAMTIPLLEAGAELVAVEYDLRLAEALGIRLADHPHFRLVQADAVRVDYDDLMGTEPWIVVANLPYAASTPILAQLIVAANRPTRMVLMLQHEMAERLAAQPDSKSYGGMSVRIQVLYEASLARRVPRTVFYPEPEVDSAILALVARADAPPMAVLDLLDRLVKVGFMQRRKKVLRLLAEVSPAAALEAAFAALALDVDARAENLSPTNFLALATYLVEHADGASG